MMIKGTDDPLAVGTASTRSYGEHYIGTVWYRDGWRYSEDHPTREYLLVRDFNPKWNVLKTMMIELDDKHKPIIQPKPVSLSYLTNGSYVLVDDDEWCKAVTDVWGELMAMAIKGGE